VKRYFKYLLALVCLIAIILLISRCLGQPSPTPPTPTPTAQPTSEMSGEATALDAVDHRQGKDLNPARLADGLVPPTNRWFSGMVFGPESLPVFPLPLSFQLKTTGFDFGLPDVQSTEKTLFGGHRPEVSVTLPGIDGWHVVAYDTVTVVAEARDASGPVGRVTLAQGSPQVTFTASRSVRRSLLLSTRAAKARNQAMHCSWVNITVPTAIPPS